MPPQLTVIYWRDIPAQVLAKDGRSTSRIVLHQRFQVAIDKAAMTAGLREMNAYIAEWRREARPCGPELEAEAAAEVARLEAAFDRATLERFVRSGGLADPDAATGGEPDTASPAADPSPPAEESAS